MKHPTVRPSPLKPEYNIYYLTGPALMRPWEIFDFHRMPKAEELQLLAGRAGDILVACGSVR